MYIVFGLPLAGATKLNGFAHSLSPLHPKSASMSAAPAPSPQPHPRGAEHQPKQNPAYLADPRGILNALNGRLYSHSPRFPVEQTIKLSLEDLGERRKPSFLDGTWIVHTCSGANTEEATFLVNAVDAVYDSGESIVLTFQENKVPEVFNDNLWEIQDILYDHLDSFLASKTPDDLPFTGEKIVWADLGIEVPEDLKQMRSVPLASLRKVKIMNGSDTDLVIYDDKLWAFKHYIPSDTLQQIRRLERLAASGTTHFVPLHAVIIDPYDHLRGFIAPYQEGGSLVDFHKTGLRVAQAEAASTSEPTAGSSVGPVQELGSGLQPIQPSGQTPIWHYSTRLSWATQLAKGVAEKHRLDMVHGDVKPENLVIDKIGRLLIIDVYCELFTEGFAAPEVLAHPYEPEYKSKQHDVYSVGMSIATIFEEGLSLRGPPTFPLAWNSENCTPLFLRRLIMECLSAKPEERPPIDHVVHTLESACNSSTSI